MKITIHVRRLMAGLVLLSVFGLGYLCGSVRQHPAAAQGIGGILEQTGKAGELLGAAKQLGASVVEMQEHVSGLQKNLDTLKKVESALTGK